MARKTVDFSKSGIGKLPNNKPVVYRIQTDAGKTNYVGIAKRGRVHERLQEHMLNSKDYVPGSKVQIQQTSRVEAARRTESLVISRTKPKYNDQGK